MPDVRRAHAVLQVKSLQPELREISGIASTPTPDRVGDIMEPTGMTFPVPAPLLLYHNQTKPVGQVWFDPPTADGLRFRAKIAQIDEPGTLRDRVEEAWQSVRAGLIRGVSIGYLPVEGAIERIKGSSGYRFLKSQILELSLVVVPANIEATIHTIKSLDTSVASDRTLESPERSGVTDTRGHIARLGPSTMKTASDQIADNQATRKQKSERMVALMAGSADQGRTLDDAEQVEYDGLAREVKAIDDHLTRLVQLEEMQKASARIVQAGTLQQASDNRAGVRVEVRSPLPPGIEFARAVQCKMAAVLSQGTTTAIEIAKMRFPDYPRIHALLKTAVTAHTTADGANTGGTELVYAQNLASEFIEFLRPTTILGRFGTGNVPSLRRVPFNVRITGQTSGGAAAWVGQGVQKPLTKYDFNAVTLTWAKVAAITVQSDELARFSSPSSEMLLRDALAGSLRERLDVDFVIPTKAAVANVSPASITNGITALTESGTDAAALRSDIGQLVQAFIDANNPLTSGVLITSQTIALQAQLMRNALGQREFPDITVNGGSLEGFPVITSQHAAFGSPVANLLILVNADDIFLADDGGVTVDVSREASLEMSDDPGGEVGTVVSLFQANLMALRAERYINWARRRTSAVAYFDAAAYASGS